MDSRAVFHRRGELFIPTELSTSPWGPTLVHGGAVGGLIAHAAELAMPGDDLRIVRITMDLFRPVPAKPLAIETRVLRDGRRARAVSISLLADGIEVTRATVLALRPTGVEAAAVKISGHTPLPGPEGIEPASIADAFRKRPGMPPPPGLLRAMELRLIKGFDGSGSGRAWFRLPVPVIEGRPNTPLLRVGLFSDLGNGLGQLSPSVGYGYINADISLYLMRLPEDEWIGLDCQSHTADGAIRLVETVLFDAHGPIGRADQATLSQPRFVPSDPQS